MLPMSSGDGRRKRLEERFAERMDQREAERSRARRRGQPTGPPGAHVCVYLGGAGFPLRPDQRYWFLITDNQLLWLTGEGAPAHGLSYTEVLDASTAGAGTVTTGGGFVGGGVGLDGAATGIAAATVLNALTQRTHVDSVLKVVTRSAEGLFAFTDTEPQRIHLELAPLRIAQRAQNPSRPGTGARGGPSVALVEALERLAALRDRGVLSQVEFDEQKRRLLA